LGASINEVLTLGGAGGGKEFVTNCDFDGKKLITLFGMRWGRGEGGVSKMAKIHNTIS